MIIGELVSPSQPISAASRLGGRGFTSQTLLVGGAPRRSRSDGPVIGWITYIRNCLGGRSLARSNSARSIRTKKIIFVRTDRSRHPNYQRISPKNLMSIANQLNTWISIKTGYILCAQVELKGLLGSRGENRFLENRDFNRSAENRIDS